MTHPSSFSKHISYYTQNHTLSQEIFIGFALFLLSFSVFPAVCLSVSFSQPSENFACSKKQTPCKVSTDSLVHLPQIERSSTKVNPTPLLSQTGRADWTHSFVLVLLIRDNPSSKLVLDISCGRHGNEVNLVHLRISIWIRNKGGNNGSGLFLFSSPSLPPSHLQKSEVLRSQNLCHGIMLFRWTEQIKKPLSDSGTTPNVCRGKHGQFYQFEVNT